MILFLSYLLVRGRGHGYPEPILQELQRAQVEVGVDD
jgi:hypothetical protein